MKIESNITSILTSDNQLVEVKTPFLPINLKAGDSVELQNGKIVIR